MDDLIIPKRTSVGITVPVEELGLGELKLRKDHVDYYQCIDCGYKCTEYDEMDNHQKFFKHSIMQRIRRGIDRIKYGAKGKLEVVGYVEKEE